MLLALDMINGLAHVTHYAWMHQVSALLLAQPVSMFAEWRTCAAAHTCPQRELPILHRR